MSRGLDWADLYRHVEGDGALAELDRLRAEAAALRAALAGKERQLGELELSVKRRLEGALRVAAMLDLAVPDDVSEKLSDLKPRMGRYPSGGYLWRPAGRVAFRSSISRAMWRLSEGSGGSAGRTGVLTSAEFRRLIGKKAWASLVSGDELTLTLPNGLTLSVAKASQLRRADHAG